MTWQRIIPRSVRHWLEGAGARTPSPTAIGRHVGVLRMVAGLSSLAPLLLLGVVAWRTWNLEIEELDSQVTTTLRILSEEAEKVFENQQLALDWIEDRTKHLTWAEIETSREFFHFAKTLADKSPYIDSVFLADAAGILRASSNRFPVDQAISVADRDYFIDAKRESMGVHVGEPAKGRLSGNVAFRVARRRSSADSSFDGIIAIGFSPTYFAKFFADIGGAASDLICLTRTDGKLLVSNSDGSRGGVPPREHPCTILMRTGAVSNSTFASTLDGATRIGGKRLLRGYPIALGYAVDLDTIRHEWLLDLALIGAAAVASSLVLFGLSFAALRIAQSEQRAIGAWQEEVRQRQRVEAEMRQASKMEALGRMAGGIAHHFNNLLPALSGLLEMTLGEVPPGSATAERLHRMLDAVSQGRRLVRSILLFSRRQVSSHERVAITTSIEETLALVQRSLPANVKVATQLRYRGEVVADRSQLQEVFMNLISNAVHAIGTKDGTIELMTEHVTIDVDAALHFGVKPGEFVRVVCRDDGAGMSSDVIEHAFDPFFTTKSAAEGTGLGLAIVHGIVNGLGGSIQVESAPGLGSSFSLYFPVAAHAERRSSPA
jgi:signal transduction histidine kinase